MGNPVVHWELWSKNPENVADFYAKIFGWKVQHIPDINYRFVDTDSGGTGINGGIFKPKDDGPWPGSLAMYIDVDDLDVYVKKIEAAGGRMIVPRAEVPNMGSYALFEDPDGRVLGIWQQKK